MDNRGIEIRQSNYLSFNFKSKKVVRNKTLDKACTFNTRFIFISFTSKVDFIITYSVHVNVSHQLP